MIRLDSEALENVHEEVWQGSIALTIKGEVLTMLEAASCKENWKIRGHMGVCVAQVTSIKHHSAIQERFPTFFV